MNKAHTAKLTEDPITPTLIRLSIPMLIGILSIVALNLIDAFFIGQIGALELAALSFTFPVVMVLGSIGMGIGVGASAIISRAMGAKDHIKSQRLTTDSIILSSGCAFIFVIIGLCFIDPTFKLLGANEEVLPLIKEYMYIWYMGVVSIMATFIGNNAIRAKGDTRTPAIIMILMVVLNIILDPILIFGLGPIPKMGLAGAALATLIARIFAFACSLYVLHIRDKLICLEIPPLKEMLNSWKKILKIGLPASATNLVVPMTAALVTRLISSYGSSAVAALGVVSRIDVLAITPIVALANVLAPFIGQNIGSKYWTRVRNGIQQSQLFAVLWGFLMLIFMLLCNSWIAPFFNEDKEVTETIILYLSIAPFGYSARSLYIVGNMTLNVLNKPLIASAITIIQMFVIYLPLVYTGAHFFGLVGIFGAMAMSYLAGGGATYFCIKHVLKDHEKPKKESVKLKEKLVVV